MTVIDYRQCRWFREGQEAADNAECPYTLGTPKYYLWHAGYASVSRPLSENATL